MTLPDVATLLRGASLRVTGPRVAVLSIIRDVPHADVSTITALARERLGAVSTQAVYDTLRTLCDARLARRIDLPDSPARYEGNTLEDHHHLVCRTCGSITDVAAQQLLTPDPDGFVIDAVEVTYWGVCSPCSTRDLPAGDRPTPVSREEGTHE